MTSERLRQLAACVVAAAAVLLSAEGAAQAPAGVTVTISVYSGRPDPAFELESGAELERVRAMIESAPTPVKVDGRSAVEPVLGYRGIVVENPGAAKGLPGRFAVHRGFIEIGTGEKDRSFRLDKDRALEEHLLALALKRGAIGVRLYEKIKAGWR